MQLGRTITSIRAGHLTKACRHRASRQRDGLAAGAELAAACGLPQSLFEGFLQAATSDTPAWMKGFLDNFCNIDQFGGTLVSDQTFQASWNVAVTASATAAVACITAWGTDFRDDLPKIDVPVLVVQGDTDRILPYPNIGRARPLASTLRAKHSISARRAAVLPVPGVYPPVVVPPRVSCGGWVASEYALRSRSPIMVMAARAVSAGLVWVKPWSTPANSCRVTGTPLACRSSARACISCRSVSYSAVRISVGGSSARRGCLAGEHSGSVT